MDYTISLDKRLVADGRGLEEVQMNEQKARENVAMRSKVQREELMLKEKEQELRALAQKARSERTGTAPAPGAPVSADKSMVDDDDMRVEQHETRREEREQRMEREKLREERWRERRLEARDAGMEKKSKITRDMDRDTSEKVSLGMANAGAGRTGEVMYDQRLFIQEKGMDSGHVADGQYRIYDKGLFTAHPTLSTLCRPKTDADTTDMYGGADEQLEKKVFKTDGFKPDKAFTRASERKGERPIEFVTGKRCDIFGYEAVMARINLKSRWRRLDDDDDEIDGDGDSGHVADGQYSIYDKGLFTAHPTLSTLYRPKTDVDTTDMYGGADEQLEKKVFTGASERPSGNKRERPIEFVTGKRCDIFGYEAVMARINLKSRWRRLDDDDEIDGDGASVLITDRYGSYGLYRI